MNSKQVQKVTDEEKDTLHSFVERYYALQELKVALEDNGDFLGETDGVMYNQVSNDLEITKQKIDDWWEKMKQKYSWQIANEQLRINFETGEVFFSPGCDSQRGC